MNKGDFPGAITFLNEMSGKVSSGATAPAVHGLLGDALAQTGKSAEAAAEYEKAAGLTAMVNEKGFWMSKAGRAYLDGGKREEARKIYEGLAHQSDNEALATEARVRLGELAAGSKA